VCEPWGKLYNIMFCLFSSCLEYWLVVNFIILFVNRIRFAAVGRLLGIGSSGRLERVEGDAIS